MASAREATKDTIEKFVIGGDTATFRPLTIEDGVVVEDEDATDSTDEKADEKSEPDSSKADAGTQEGGEQ